MNEIRMSNEMNWLGQNFYYYEEISSTNVKAKEMAKDGAPHGTVVAAGKQTAGRGRRGRSWHSPSGTNLYFSIVTRPDMPVEKAPMITLVTAYAAAGVLERMIRDTVEIKWPNDIVAGGKKLCGILTEMNVEQGKISYIVTGIGINVNMTDIPDEIKETASSLSLLCGREIAIDELREQLCIELEKAYDKFFEEGSLEPFWEDYNKKLVNCGKQVRVLDPAGEYDGISRGIDHEGNLIVEKADGECVTVFSGEVSVRGIYGYV